jgi:hypothetical protein
MHKEISIYRLPISAYKITSTTGYLLVIKPGSDRVIASEIASLIQERIWPNPEYAWITAIGLFTPRWIFSPEGKDSLISVYFNPNARIPPAVAFVAMVEGKETFHLEAG